MNQRGNRRLFKNTVTFIAAQSGQVEKLANTGKLTNERIGKSIAFIVRHDGGKRRRQTHFLEIAIRLTRIGVYKGLVAFLFSNGRRKYRKVIVSLARAIHDADERADSIDNVGAGFLLYVLDELKTQSVKSRIAFTGRYLDNVRQIQVSNGFHD